MNRLQKKCFMVSSALHALLAGTFLFGSAFFVSKEKPNPAPMMLNVIDPDSITDALTSTGGGPSTAVPPPAPPAQPTPQPPQPVVQPPQPVPQPPKAQPKPAVEKVTPKVVEPPKPIKKLTAKDLEPLAKTKPVEPPKKPNQRLNPDELKPTKRQVTKESTEKEMADTRAQQIANAKRRLERQFGKSYQALSKDIITDNHADTLPGDGSGAPLAAAYRDIVASKYTAAWAPPADLNDDLATVTVSVTISSDGRVINGRITKSSGNKAMDRSIETMLDNVTYIMPFPQGTKDRERTYTIKFNLQAKRSLG